MFFKRLFSVTRASLPVFLGLSGGPGLARDVGALIHQMPPLAPAGAKDIIHQFPPLRPVPQPRSGAPLPPREPYDAPTLAEAPRKPLDGPTLAELGVPPPEPAADAGEKFAEARAHAEDFELIPEAGSSPLAEIYARHGGRGTPSGRARAGAFDMLRAKTDLAGFRWPVRDFAPAGYDARTRPPPQPPLPAPGVADGSASRNLSFVAAGVLLVMLLLLAFAKRKGLLDTLLARLAKLRGAGRDEEDAPTPPVDISRLDRLARRSSAAPPAPEAPRKATEPAGVAPSPDAGGVIDDLVLVEPGDAAAASAAINAARTQREGNP